MRKPSYVQPDLGYGEGGFAAFPALPGQSHVFPSAVLATEDARIIAVLRDLYADRRGVFIRLDERGALDTTLGDAGFKRVEHPGSALFGYLEFWDLIQVPADQGGGYVALSKPEIPVQKDSLKGQAIHIAFTRFSDSLDIVPRFGDKGVSMPGYEAKSYGDWERVDTLQTGVERSEAQRADASVNQRGHSIVGGKLRVVHPAHVRNNGFNFYRLLLIEVDLVTGETSALPLEEVDIGNPSGLTSSCVFRNDGSLIVAGRSNGASNGAALVAAYHSDGSLDRNFGRAGEKYGYVAYASGHGLVWQETGQRILMLADRLRRLESNGETDSSYQHGEGYGLGGIFMSGLLDSGQGFIHGSYDGNGLGLQRFTETELDPSFADQGYYSDRFVSTVLWGTFMEGKGLYYHVQKTTGDLPLGILKLLWQPID